MNAAHGAISRECLPHSSANATFPATIGMDTLRLEFIHPDGRSIYAARLHTPDYQFPVAPLALAARGPVNLSETEDNVLVQVAGTLKKVDKNTGQINSWRAGDHELLIGGPILNLGEDLGGGKNSGRKRPGGSGGRPR